VSLRACEYEAFLLDSVFFRLWSLGNYVYQVSHFSGSSGIMGIMVIDSFSVWAPDRVCWVSLSLRVPVQNMVHPIIQRKIAIGKNSSVIKRFRVGFSPHMFLRLKV